ncbi:MAG: ATP-binding protein [Pseudonocardiaceae bacterium]
MDLLDGFEFHRLISVPRRPVDSPEPDPTPAQLFAALTAAHAELRTDHHDAPLVAVAWQRPQGHKQLRVLVGGRPFFPPGGSGTVSAGRIHPILYPPGGIGETVDPHQVVQELADFPAWLRCPGQPDPLWMPDAERRENGQRHRGGFDDCVAHLAEPFAWLILAEPLSAEAVDRELLMLATHVPRLRQRENSELDRIALERAQGRYRELSRARASGMWNVHVLVGGATAAEAHRAAALLCSASDLDELPYILLPGTKSEPFDLACRDVIKDAEGPRSPFSATTELLAALARPPRRELAGIRLVEQADFDLTPERDGAIRVGEVLDDSDQPVGPFGVGTDTLNRHTFVAGATGAGKSQTVRHLLEGLHHAGIPWLVIEPAKAEYARMAGRIGHDQIAVIRPGDLDAIPVGLNPMEPEDGFPLQTHIDLVRALFLAAFEANEPFPQVLSHALTRCYSDLGWDTVLNESRLAGVLPKYPSLGDLQRTALDVVEGIGYGKEITDNVRGFIDVRIGSLRLGTPGRFFEGGHPLDVADLLRRNVVLEIEDIGNDQDKAFFIGVVLIRLYEHLRVRRGSAQTRLQHVTVVEEAHRLLKRVEPGSPAAHAVELFTALLAEIRAYGEGIIIAEQIPAKIIPDVIKNTAFKIIHRLPAADDRDAVGATMNLDEAQSRHVVSLPPGRAAVFADGMDRPLRIEVPLGEERESHSGTSRAVAITRARSVACGPQCQMRPCVLRETNNGGRLAEDPKLILWIELLTVAHLAGRPAPRPEQAWLDELAGRADRRAIECAIAHRVQAAIDSRYTGLTAYYQPESLAAHLADSAFGRLNGTTAPCNGTEVRWQAGRYRWVDVLQALKNGYDPVDQPHPHTAAWAARGLHLTGRTQAEQLSALRQHPDYWRPSRTVITGTSPTYVAATTELSSARDPKERFLNAIKFLHLTTTWPLSVLDVANPLWGSDTR